MKKSKADLDVISIAIAIVSFILAAVMMSGGFSGGQAQCGDFGFTCLGNAFIVLVIGTMIGFVTAVMGLILARWRSWYGWIGLILNGLPALALCGWLLLVFVARG
ncbi:hypothetical protein RugamoR64_27910 [Duganella rhizosphaerae]|uniref:hypothetical protein n=1 Tax=Duganella rhizosphaerae TaxID=2885763 RepID=UPI0030E9EEC7